MALYFMKVDILNLFPGQTGEDRNLRTLSVDQTHVIDGVTYDTSLLNRQDVQEFCRKWGKDVASA